MRICDWSGEEFEDPGYVLTTTGGREVIAYGELRDPLRQVETLATLVDALTERVATLEAAAAPAAPATLSAATKKTAASSAKSNG